MQFVRSLGHRAIGQAHAWASAHGVLLLRASLGIIFLWFGVLKFFHDLSPAQDLALRTISKLTFGVVPAPVSLFVLALWECTIGLGLLCNLCTGAALSLLFVQMAGTLTSVVFFPQEMFMLAPYAPTMEGQYVIKNLVLISAGVVLAGNLGKTAGARPSLGPTQGTLFSGLADAGWKEAAYSAHGEPVGQPAPHHHA